LFAYGGVRCILCYDFVSSEN